ncbi:eukaryotic translation initiation factor 2-alpha kinase-like [Aedes albopictus]|uniref:Uncharacterized protein n=1 Tax=Aedes albopictus TaxID=7160 RepID=A0ABM2A4W6_AEDAL
MNGGTYLWSVETGPGVLLSSSIHRLELSNIGKWVRMIPSLSGGLYKFDGDTIEPIPFSAEDLLKSSFKFSDRDGDHGGHCEEWSADDVVVIRRQTQTVRAVESRTGSERWNFSIGHHELEMLKNEDCRGGGGNDALDPAILDLEMKVVIPEGVVFAVKRSEPGVTVWQHQGSTSLTTRLLWNGNGQPSIGSDEKGSNGMINPSLYLGMHQRQLYIQESTALMVRQATDAQTVLLTDEGKFPMIPWKPYPARLKVTGYITDGMLGSTIG